MLWLYLLLIAHLLNAIVFMLAKYFVSGPIPSTKAYAFWESVGSAAYLVLIPFGVVILPIGDLTMSLLSGFVFSIALVFLYNSIKTHNISGVAPAIGAMTAIFTLILSFFFLKVSLNNMDLWAFVLLVIGTLLASNMRIDNHDARIKLFHELSSAIVASLLFAIFYVLIKIEYNQLGFINPFFWSRIGMIIGAGFILVFMNKDKAIGVTFNSTNNSLKAGFIGTKLLAGFAFLLIAIAAFLGNVALVNAMQGLQYMFLIIISFILLRIRPGWVGEHYTRHEWIHKISAVIFIIGGLVLLGLGGR